MENAIHGASTEEDADQEIKLIFGGVEFKWDGTTSMDMAYGIACCHLSFFLSVFSYVFFWPC